MKNFLTSKFIKYIGTIVLEEKLKEIAIVTSSNISELVEKLSNNFNSINVYNKINNFCSSADIYFIFPDSEYSYEEIGLIKNLINKLMN